MKSFMDQDFLLKTKTAQILYHEYAKGMPLIDYHCHLSPQQIADDINFNNLTQAWLYGDHYKWRAMRANGVPEDYCTGQKSDTEKFKYWAVTVPFTMRNPLYHWTHLELQRYFGIKDILNSASANSIYEQATEQLVVTDYSTKNLIRKMNVKVICTTDDPIDSLEHHKKIVASGFEVKVIPAFRPDKAMEVSNSEDFIAYVKKLEAVTNLSISSFEDFLFALQNRHDFFATMGCSVSDHGLEEIYAEDFTGNEVEAIFNKIYGGKFLNEMEQRKFKSCMLLHFAECDWFGSTINHWSMYTINNFGITTTIGESMSKSVLI